MDNIIGKKIEGRYQVSELIGVGGMANVYKATDTVDNKEVAIKILREEFYQNEEFLRRFKNESKAIAMLSHPNIVKVYDVCFSRGIQMIVMEYLDGITLKEYLEQQGALSWKETVHFTRQILQALSHAHERGVVHRDMKPQNVMMLSDGSLKLADFGIARFARSEAKTLTDKAIGSVHYISPEQARGENIDHRTDIYSVGVMMFEMLSGQLPFDADSAVSVALKQIQLTAPSLLTINPSIPEALDNITVKAMEKLPEMRYATAKDMLADIDLFKQNPNASFEYQYLTNPSTENIKYKKAIKKVKNAVDDNPEHHSKRNENAIMPRKVEPKPKKKAKQNENDDYDTGGSVLVVLAGITAAFVFISVAFILTTLYISNPLEKVAELKLPELIGLNYDEVKIAPEYTNLEIVVEETRYNANHPKGDIIDQSPKAGKNVKINSTVKVIVSSGQELVKVPNVLGFEETVAYQMLAESELEYQKVELFSGYPIGTVINTEPGPDSDVGAGSMIKVIVSMGTQNTAVNVPNVVGQSLTGAKKILADKGVQLGGIHYVASDLPRDQVIAQDPAFGSILEAGAFISLNVSAGPSLEGQITLSIPLPVHETTTMKLTAMHNDAIISEAMVVPSMAINWRPTFQGSGSTQIHILYDNIMYMTCDVNFDNQTWTISTDNSAQFN